MLGILEYARYDCNLNCIKYGNNQEIGKEVAGAAGLEPATIGFGDRCSTNWNYAPAMSTHYNEQFEKVKRKYQLLDRLLFLSAKRANSYPIRPFLNLYQLPDA